MSAIDSNPIRPDYAVDSIFLQLRCWHQDCLARLQERRKIMLKNSRPWVLAAAFALSIAADEARAQPNGHRMEISVHYTALNFSAIGETEVGFGARLGFNVNDYLTIEGEGSYFSRHHLGNDLLTDKDQWLIGVKAGKRNRWVGAFAKVRAGIVGFPEIKTLRGFCGFGPDTLNCDRDPDSGRRFSTDAGAVFEFYPTRRVIVRADVSDSMIRFNDDTLLNRRGDRIRADGISHNFQFTAGVGYRF
jgi:Outer membrane protein beta-barrel domain